MRTTVDLDENLLKMAGEVTGIKMKTKLLEEGLRALLRRQAYQYLATLSGSAPHAKAAPRRRFK